MHKRMCRRTLSALLLAAGLSCPAWAEVTIGGSIEADILLEGSEADGFRDNVQLDVEPRLFFAGEDKLDNGSSVIWKIWTGAENYRSDSAKNNDNNSGNGSRTWGNREAWGGWKGGWGQVRLGKVYSPSYMVLDWPYAAQGGSMHIEEVGLLGFNIDNAIVYDSPNLSGFTISGMYALRTQANQVDGNGNEYFADITAGYSGYGAMLNVGYQQAKPRLKDGHVSDDQDEFAFIAGGYTFGDSGFTLRGGYKWWQCTASANAGAGEGGGFADNVGGCNYFTGPEQQHAWVQGIYAFGKNSFSLGYNYFFGAKDINGSKIDDSDSQTLLGRYTYTMSKNTAGYFDVRYGTNDTNGNIGATYGTSYGAKAGTDSYRLLLGTWTGF
ncbi:hypothetical protein JHS3_16450 [Jeongeupia sp. HS-3]|uniref:porin n=1 Tax=Jeongeupia sp. HS-3 TaxID=1009682 RepID=UPI0018A63FA2|nr:porin [Jeongeupia sp. HS-3]BCL75909.1 hypothetical protein JHS3_16450 [Jeongeupia sp. HS-3]